MLRMQMCATESCVPEPIVSRSEIGELGRDVEGETIKRVSQGITMVVHFYDFIQRCCTHPISNMVQA